MYSMLKYATHVSGRLGMIFLKPNGLIGRLKLCFHQQVNLLAESRSALELVP